MSYPAIEAKGVRFSYGKNEILHGMDFAAQKGQLIAVLGPNGAGKSTLFRCLLGLYHSYQGSITIEGREVKNMQPREIAAKVAYIPQTHTPTFHYTVLEMVLMGTAHRVRGLQSPGAKEVAIAREALAQVGIADMENRSYGRLSGGEQQMLAIGRGLMANPRLLLLDEPSLGLAPIIVNSVMQTIKRINEQGITILLVEQNAKKALAIANKACVLEQGKIIQTGTGQELLNDSKIIEAYLGGTKNTSK